MKDPLNKFSSTILRINAKTLSYIAIGCVSIVVLLVVITFYMFGRVNSIEQTKQMEVMVTELKEMKENQVMGNQFLVSQISYGEERQRIMLFIRDTIMGYWEKVNYSKRSIDKAFVIAKNNVEVAEIYPNIDAIALAAMQFQESRWNVKRLSPAGAEGLNHIMPTTALSLANQMGLSYTSRLALDDRINTEMAAKHLDNSLTIYPDWGIALADYNGGPKSATPYRLKKFDEMHPETRKYVPEVLGRLKAFQKNLKTYKADIKNVSVSGKK